MRCNKIGAVSNLLVRMQLIEQRLGLLQITRVEAFSEPAVNRSKQFTSLLRLPLVTPETRKGSRTRDSGLNGPQVFVPATISAVTA